MPFQYPLGNEHLQLGTFVSGYTLGVLDSGNPRVYIASTNYSYGLIPVSYQELERYYDMVEYEQGVSGLAGNVARELREGGNPFESPRSERARPKLVKASGLRGSMASELSAAFIDSSIFFSVEAFIPDGCACASA